MAKIDGIEDWLIDQALRSPSLPEVFGQLCEHLRSVGIPIERCMLGWATLHPLIDAETVLWEFGSGIEHRTFMHTDKASSDWLQSPMRSVLEDGKDELRLLLDDTANAERFPICGQLASEGFTDYLLLSTYFDLQSLKDQRGSTGILVSWATKSPGGFTEDEIGGLRYIQKRLAISARAKLESQISRNIAETYLGNWAGSKVLSGQIRHGDGERIDAVIFYSDMRRSTQIAEELGPDGYLPFLNAYFDATASPVLQCGGEILDFIGDAVLGIFPIKDLGLKQAALRAITAADMACERVDGINRSGHNLHPLDIGIALSVGEVMFGNIGVANRLTFSAIGQTVHVAARMEALTKQLGKRVLMTEEIAENAVGRSEPAGIFQLSGFSSEQRLLALTPK
ncbi:adenylate/guanylate cyclase domain-containing protein [Roseibium sp.]|uniref:adenylate/guanylate cyclase domain-containing protein n=1 Tax=Roseibium sp. TaxID=1936156 RepID=UPI003A97057B